MTVTIDPENFPNVALTLHPDMSDMNFHRHPFVVARLTDEELSVSLEATLLTCQATEEQNEPALHIEVAASREHPEVRFIRITDADGKLHSSAQAILQDSLIIANLPLIVFDGNSENLPDWDHLRDDGHRFGPDDRFRFAHWPVPYLEKAVAAPMAEQYRDPPQPITDIHEAAAGLASRMVIFR